MDLNVDCAKVTETTTRQFWENLFYLKIDLNSCYYKLFSVLLNRDVLQESCR